MNNLKYINPNYTGSMLICGYLQKLKSENAKSRFLKKFNKRYFILDLTNYYFGYKDKENSTKIQTFPLTDLINVDPNPRIIEICDWKFAFVVQLGNRVYHLYADSVSLHNEWCTGLKACLKPLERLKSNDPYQAIQPIVNRNSPVEDPTPYVKPPKHPMDEELERIGLALTNPSFSSPQGEVFIKDSPEVKVDERKSMEIPQNAVFLDVRNKSEVPEVEKRQSGSFEAPQSVYNPPKLEVIRANLAPAGKKNLKNDEDEDEVTVLSGPRTQKKEDDPISLVTPVIFIKDRPQSRGMAPVSKPEIVESVNSEPGLFSNKFVKPANDVKIEFRPGGMLDMMNEFENLGLEQVQIRPVVELKKKLTEGEKKGIEVRKKVENGEGMNEERKKEKFEEKGVEREEKRQNEYFELQRRVDKKGLGEISVKANFGKVKIKSGYVEKPEIVPDEQEYVKKESKPQKAGEKQVFVEKNPKSTPQGTDCDWDEWDS